MRPKKYPLLEEDFGLRRKLFSYVNDYQVKLPKLRLYHLSLLAYFDIFFDFLNLLEILQIVCNLVKLKMILLCREGLRMKLSGSQIDLNWSNIFKTISEKFSKNFEKQIISNLKNPMKYHFYKDISHIFQIFRLDQLYLNFYNEIGILYSNFRDCSSTGQSTALSRRKLRVRVPSVSLKLYP